MQEIVLTHVFACKERTILGVIPLVLSASFETKSLTNLDPTVLSVCPRKPQGSAHLSGTLGLRMHMSPCLAFVPGGSGHLTWVLACKKSALSSEPPLKLRSAYRQCEVPNEKAKHRVESSTHSSQELQRTSFLCNNMTLKKAGSDSGGGRSSIPKSELSTP